MKKLFAALLSLAMITAFLTACSTPAADDSTTDSSSESSSSSASTETSGESIVLQVFDAHAYGLDEYAEMAAKFEEEHPGVTIEVQHAANDSATLLQSRVNANDVPDVFAVEAGTAAANYAEYAYNWKDDTDILSLFHEDAIAINTDEDGNIYGLPWTYENAGLLYNKDLFEQAGITTLPTTLDELEQACIKLEEAGITAFYIASQESWVLAQLSTHFMMDKSIDAEGVLAGLYDGSLTFNDLPNFQNLFRFIDLTVKYGPDKPLEVDWETSENKLANNEAAIISMGDWCQSVLDSFNPDANVGFLPTPVSDNPEDVTVLSSCNWTYIVNKDSENLELAKEYVEFILTSETGQWWMAEGVGVVPAAITDMEVSGTLANDAMQYIAAGETNGWIHTSAPSGFTGTVGTYIQAYITGDMTPEQVTEAYQTFWTQ